MIASPLRSLPFLAIAVAAVAAAPLVSSAVAGAALATAGAVALGRSQPAGRGRGRLLLAWLIVALLAASWIVERAERGDSARAALELERSHAALWEELGSFADAAARQLRAEGALPEGQRERFGRLRSTAAADADQRLNLLLWDRFGELDAWWGPGLLPDLDAGVIAGHERGVTQSALAVTLHVAQRFRDASNRWWTVIAAESFPRDGAPPVAHADRRRWGDVRWSLERDGDGELEGLRLALGGGEPRRIWSRRLRSAAVGCAALLLLVWSVGLVARPLGEAAGRAASSPGRRLAIGLGLGACAALLALAFGGGAATAAALAATGVGLAASVTVAIVLRERGAPILLQWVGRALALAAGPTLLVVASASGGGGELLAELSLLSVDTSAWRIALSALTIAVLALAAVARSGRNPVDSGRLSELWPWAAALAAALLIDWVWASAVALALTGVGAAEQLARWRGRSLAERLGSLLLATLVAAVGWSAGERRAEVAVLEERLASFLPPSTDAMATLAVRVERHFESLDPAALLPRDSGPSVPDDLAFAIWRRSPLARADLLSTLLLIGPDGGRTLFSSGLPVDGSGRLDLSPTRWIDLAPPAWLDRRVGGETAVRVAGEGGWTARWLAVPLPGCDPRREELAATSTVWAGSPGAVDRVAIYDATGDLLRSPWSEGTPPFAPQLLADKPFTQIVATPVGAALTAARADAGMIAVAFLPKMTAWRALERAGAFVTGTWTPVLAAGLLAGLWLVPWSMVTAELRLLWRSYSRRLVLVFTLLLLVPLAIGSTWVAHSYAQRLERQQEDAALDSLHSAQRILGEYVLSLEPGFGVGTAVDDRLLEWLARVVRSEVHLYWGSELYASSKRDLFAAGLLPTRLPGEIWERIHLSGDRVVRRAVRGGEGETAEIYARLEIPGQAAEATKLVLSLPRRAQQGELAAEIAGIRRRAFLAAAALAVLLAVSGAVLARRFARPIEEIVRGTQRIAEGAATLDYVPDELELEALAGAIDRMAQRVAGARERLLVEKNLAERIAENVTAAVVGLDAAGRVVFANRLAREMLHAAPGEALRERLRGGGIDALADAFAAGASSAEATATRVDLAGEKRDWTLVRVPLPGAGDPAELVVVEDVTDVVRAQRLDAWAGMARIIAHEIKNPLTPIRLSAEHLREAWSRDREHFEGVFERCTGNILRQVEELRRTASEFSLYSEIPRIERRRDDLREAVAEVVEAYRAAPPAGVEVVFDAAAPAVPALFDRRLLGRAVRNLIENAVRASGESGRVEITVEERSEAVVVRVVDEGPGVSPELLSRVVEPYFSTQSGGTGLGLPIARRVAEEHGGELSLRNVPSGGLEVTITIPRR